MHRKVLDAAKDFHIQGANERAVLSRMTTSNHDTFVVHSFKPVSGYVVVFMVPTRKSMRQGSNDGSDTLDTSIEALLSRSSTDFFH